MFDDFDLFVTPEQLPEYLYYLRYYDLIDEEEEDE